MADKVSPIRPNEVDKEQIRIFPDAVFESFNELIAQAFSGACATVRQKDVVVLMMNKGLARKDIFDKGWLNIQEVYREAGWKVVYDSPAIDESFEPYFRFERK